ncbi:CBO0543 family protein [Paenibacillus sp. S-38]|uniref:CBO0543 family protein n=1 Tax=Paenibacillus sp. S-38 TaxID=3416710 RepID=UPI003CEA7FBF
METALGEGGAAIFFVLVALIALTAVRLTRSYRRWERYLPTVLFMIFCSMLYYFLVRGRLLWEYTPATWVTHWGAELLLSFVVFPCTVLLLLDLLPRSGGKLRLARYLLNWSFVYLLTEQVALQMHFMRYHRGWSFGWSVFFVCTMFLILYLHHRCPLAAYLATVGLIVLYMVWFRIPFPIFLQAVE